MIKLSKGNQRVTIEAGELKSYTSDGHEYIHQAGSPGWGHSDTEMFPVIGPTADASYRVQVPRGNAIQDQHGLLRDMEYTRVEANLVSASFKKEYAAGTPVQNAKFPDRSSARLLIWPYSFQLNKEFVLSDMGLSVHFTLSGEKDMPYMFGYHPAFKVHGTDPRVVNGNRSIALEEVLAVGSRALLLAGATEVELHDVRNLKIRTTGFRDFMLWTEVPNMICIEPVTFYPYAVGQEELHTGFDYLGDNDRHFSVILQPDGL